MGLPLFLSALSFVLICGVFATIFLSGKYLLEYAEVMQDSLSLRLLTTARFAAGLMDEDTLNELREPADMEKELYRQKREELMRFAEKEKITYVYFMRIVGEELRYIIDNDQDPKTQVTLGMTTAPDGYVMNAFAGRAVSTHMGNYAGIWEGLMSAYAPVFDARGQVVAVAGVDIKDSAITAATRQNTTLNRIFSFEISAIIVVGVTLLALSYRNAKAYLRALQIKNRFLSQMSHQMRTPMNVIIGMSELAQREYGKPKGLEHIGYVKQAGSNLLSLINDILDFSEIEAGRMEIQNARYRTASLLIDVMLTLRAQIGEKEITFLSDLDKSIPSVMIGDETRVRQILLNLLSNAVKYTKKGFVKFTARSDLRPDASVFLTFTVEDSGIGVRTEDLDKLFDKFSRLDAERNTHILGTGLGLPIARKLCNAMGGDITVRSEYGVGSTFTATIAQEIADAAPMGPLSDETPELYDLRFTAPGFRVLAVDDIPTNLAVIEGLLAPYKMDLRTCESGAEAVELARKGRFDLVFMDHMMPGMDGIEAVRAIRAMGDDQPLIVALTANAVPGMREVFLENGFDDFLSKPIEISKLRELLEKWVPTERRAPVKKKSDLMYKVGKVNGKITITLESKEREKSGTGEAPEIEGIDAAKGLALCGGSPTAYRKVLELYHRDAEARMECLSLSYAESDLKNFTIHAHGMKSSSANIGAARLSAMAASLEEAGKGGDMGYIRASVGAFQKALSEMSGRIRAALSKENKKRREAVGPVALASRLKALKEALEARDVGTVDNLLTQLSEMSLEPQTADVLTEISDLVLSAEFEKAAEKLTRLFGNAD
ncbi:MAG: response regulator [Synergistaceae bacterium]|jgi:signal transduction histidine kinase/CheY-like chemotaxis protein/HPt (histidine-containing phosphotransfer) domain-containing protein|nr:response regulator [Synergistaceae bacterium]